jgi:hypothetical protein
MKAECSTCHKTISLNNDGSLRRHGDGLYEGKACPGEPLMNKTVTAAGDRHPTPAPTRRHEIEHRMLTENYASGVASVTCLCGATIRVEDGPTEPVALVRMARMIYEDHMVVARTSVPVVR